MGQSAAISQELLSQLEIHISHEPSRSPPSAELNAKPLVTNTSTKSSSCRRNFDAEFTLGTKVSNQSQDEHVARQDQEDSIDTTILLQIQPKGRALADDEKTEFHCTFQQFCLHSSWIDADTLVLPLQSQRIRLLLPSSASDSRKNQAPKPTKKVTTSNLCNRVFSISGPLVQGKVIAIQENYGDTMGSHIWDASILLSFALCKASRFPDQHTEQHCQQKQRGSHVMLELGAGCGLFAAVYSTLCEIGSSLSEAQDIVNSMIRTERRESLELLRSNLHLNSQGVESGSTKGQQEIHFLPLVWGTRIDLKHDIPRVDTIFVADVLYNWSAHKPLLRTMDEIIRHHRRRGGSAREDSVAVVIAHKHRGKPQLRPC